MNFEPKGGRGVSWWRVQTQVQESESEKTRREEEKGEGGREGGGGVVEGRPPLGDKAIAVGQ